MDRRSVDGRSETRERRGQTRCTAASLCEWIERCGPAPPNSSRRTQRSIACREIRRGVERENRRKFFGGERNVAADLPSSCAISTRVAGGTLMPAISAIIVAGRPTTCVLGACAPAEKNQRAERADFVGGEKICALLAALVERLFAHGFFGDDGLLGGADRAVVEVLPAKMSATAFFTLAVRSMNAGTLPGPDAVGRLAGAVRGAHQTRAAGGENHADVRRCFISSCVPCIVGCSHATDQAVGRALCRRRLARARSPISQMQRIAEGCGLRTMALRALSEIRVL